MGFEIVLFTDFDLEFCQTVADEFDDLPAFEADQMVVMRSSEGLFKS